MGTFTHMQNLSFGDGDPGLTCPDGWEQVDSRHDVSGILLPLAISHV